MIDSVRIRKVAGDLAASRARSALVVLSIAVGVTAIGTVVGARALMGDALDAAREEARFPSATLVTDPLDSALVERLRGLPGVEALEARRVLRARLGDGRQLTLTAASSWEHARLARISPERGAWPPPEGEVLLERESLVVPVGDELQVLLPDGRRRALRVAGTVHDVTRPSARTSGIFSGYVTVGTLRRLGHTAGPSELLVRGPALPPIRAEIERRGLAVLSATAPDPGEFWAEDQVGAMVLLLTVLGGVALLMSGFAVANIVSALVAQQIRQIGVLKAVGGTARDAATLYLAAALALGLLALAISVPLGALGATALVHYSAVPLNLEPPSFRVAPEAVALQAASALLVPLLAALGPVLAGARVTVREAVAAQGLGAAGADAKVARLAGRAPWLSASSRLSLANVARKPRRLLLTLAALVLAGTALVAVLSVRSSLTRTLDDAAAYRSYDVLVELAHPVPAEDVRTGEAWPVASAFLGEGDSFTVFGAPPRTELVRPFVVEGRWLRPGDGAALVVNDQLLDAEPGLRVGAAVPLTVDGRAGTWRVVGVVRGLLEGPLAYAPATELGGARRVLAAGPAASTLPERLEEAGIPVAAVVTSDEQRELDEENYGILVSFLLVMAVLLAVVGGLGLAGTLWLGVLERTREVGVLRAIGAGNGTVMRLVVAEGVAVAGVAALISIPLAVPAGEALSQAVGELFLGGPVSYDFAGGGALLWLALALAVALVAGALPALRAARMRVRELVAYE